MKITKPFQDYRAKYSQEELPVWFFEDCELPNIDFNNLSWTDEFNQEKLLSYSIYKKRLVARWVDNFERNEFSILTPYVKNIIESIRDTSPIEKLETQWPYDTWNMDSFYFDIKKDVEGFHMGPHLDNRNIKWTFIMNMEDNPNSTTFYINNKVVQGPNKRGSGVFYFNHHELLHSIGPIKSDRFILFYMNVVK